MIDLRKILLAGHAQLQLEHKEKEKGRDSYRIGSSGAVIGTEVYGTCHRIAHLRELGIEEEPSLGTDIMWKAGEANEWTWDRILKAAQRSGKLKGEIDTQVETVAHFDGVDKPVEGHPDVILREGGVELGIELKGIFGWSTAELAWVKHTPKNPNLIQAAAYAHTRGIEYCLAYTCHHFPKVPSWEKKKFTDRLMAEFGHNWLDPFYSIFYMKWENEKLCYRHEDETEWVVTEVTAKSIEDYYRLLVDIRKNKRLGPRVSSHYLNGEQNKWGKESDCGLCSHNKACGLYDSNRDYDQWLDEVKDNLGIEG